MPLRCVAYEPRAAERSVLYRVVEEHLERFLDGAADHADGTRLPKFVEQEFRGAGARLCSPVAQDRLRLLDDGRILLTLKTAWADGTRLLRFEPLELLEKLAALTPRPRINLVLYHGVLAPHARWRARVVAAAVSPPMLPLPLDRPGHPTDDARTKHGPTKHLHWAWAHLMRRAFEIDVLACPRCGGHLRLIATLEDPQEIREVLAGLVLSAEPVDRAPPFCQSFAASPTADVCA